MKREAINHTKMKRLCRSLGIPLWQAMGLLEAIWHTTAREAPRGDLGRLSDDDIAIGIEYAESASEMVSALADSGWIDRNAEVRLIVHDWHEHAPDAVQMKIARSKQYFVSSGVGGGNLALMAPKLGRLPSWERAAAMEFYENKGVSTADTRREHGVSTADTRREHGVSTADTRRDGYPDLDPPLTTTSTSTSTKQKSSGSLRNSTIPAAARANGAAADPDWPKTELAICSRFPSADFVLVRKIIEDSMRAYLCVASPKIPKPDDSVLAQAVADAAEQSVNQKSPALFLKKVPTLIENLAKFGRNGKNGQPQPRAADIDPKKILPLKQFEKRERAK